MSDLILHHYPNSPFAEKIRLAFGLKNLAWRSCDVSPIMPKPELQALTGGYRRVPVLQMGADVYCDTLLICEVLESINPAPSLYPHGLTGLARTLAQWADGTLFPTAMAYNFSSAGGAEFARLNPDLVLIAQPCAVVRRVCCQAMPRQRTNRICAALQRCSNTHLLCWVTKCLWLI
jgi:glutathione S-transferase